MTIRVSKEVARKLEELKPKLFAGSYDEVIRELIRRAEDPKTALESLAGWMMDVRNDVKTLIQLLDEFCDLLCSVAGRGRLRRVVKEVEEVKS
jgi:predicted CopG family antitoxin